MSKVLVTGGSGFIGSHCILQLLEAGHEVRTTVRNLARESDVRAMLAKGGWTGQADRLTFAQADLEKDAGWAEAAAGCDYVLHVASPFPAGVPKDENELIVPAREGTLRVLRAARDAGVERPVQISAIGADANSPSAYAASKADGESAVHAAFPTATILRPSIIFGAEDQFFNRFGSMALFFPFMPVICGATKFQPVYVSDVADAAFIALTEPGHEGRLYELGGPEVVSFREILQYILTTTGRDRPLITVPYGIAKLQAMVLEHIPGKPLTRDQLLLLRHDNVVQPGAAGFAELGLIPTPYELIVPAYLRRYRRGGDFAIPATAR